MVVQFRNNKVLFRSNKVSFHSRCCCDLTGVCTNCNDPVPPSVDVIITNMVDYNCNNCDSNINGAHNLPQLSNCLWKKSFTFNCDLSPFNSIPVDIEVQKYVATTTGRIRIGTYVITFAETPDTNDCFSWSNYNLPYFSITGTTTFQCLFHTSMTMHISAGT